MAILATNNAVERELTPEGTHVAICYSMIDLGTKEEDYEGQTKKQHKARLEWELPGETFTYTKDDVEHTGAARIGKDYTLSMNEKSNLRKDLTSWRGQAFTEDQAKSFDITVLIGKPCLITITHSTTKAGKKYAKISGIANMVKGMEIPKQINENFLFEFDNYSEEKFAMIPKWIQDLIKESDEYKAIHPTPVPGTGGDAAPTPVEAPKEDNDDLPF